MRLNSSFSEGRSSRHCECPQTIHVLPAGPKPEEGSSRSFILPVCPSSVNTTSPQTPNLPISSDLPPCDIAHPPWEWLLDPPFASRCISILQPAWLQILYSSVPPHQTVSCREGPCVILPTSTQSFGLLYCDLKASTLLDRAGSSACDIYIFHWCILIVQSHGFITFSSKYHEL